MHKNNPYDGCSAEKFWGSAVANGNLNPRHLYTKKFDITKSSKIVTVAFLPNMSARNLKKRGFNVLDKTAPQYLPEQDWQVWVRNLFCEIRKHLHYETTLDLTHQVFNPKSAETIAWENQIVVS